MSHNSLHKLTKCDKNRTIIQCQYFNNFTYFCIRKTKESHTPTVPFLVHACVHKVNVSDYFFLHLRFASPITSFT